jgi:glycosyltransferase involved in cell wall biosynthesis
VRIALDGTPLTVPTGGIRRYTEELACALAAGRQGDFVYLLSDGRVELPPGGPPNLKRGPGPMNAAERRWWLWGLRRELSRLAIDVFHGTDFAVPYLRSKPTVMTIHDLSPWRDETAEFTSERVRRRTPIVLGLGLATMVITPTEVIRRAAIERFRLAPERVVAVPHAASARFRPVVSDSPPPLPYFLFVGTIGPRKNLTVLIDALHELRKSCPAELWIAGRAPEAVQCPDARQGVRWLGAVADENLPALYSGAAAALYPSTYEGFGLPVIEAMQCGTPVIASTDPAVTEVAGGAALHAATADVRAWVDAMRALLAAEARAQWSERSLLRAAEFSWERTARRTRDVYEEARLRFDG